MSFLSLEFWAVFPCFFWVYWRLAARPGAQNLLLLLAGYALLAGLDYRFALSVAAYTALVYCLARLIHCHPEKKFFFVLSLFLSLSYLGVFKYHDFFRGAAQEVLERAGFDLALPALDIMLPLGISFYTFHSISYLVSVWKRELAPVPLMDFALFLSFFPSLVSGPINRARDFLPQIQTVRQRKIGAPCKAYSLLLLALAKLLWFSPLLLETWIKPVFDNPSEFHSLDILLAVYSYAIQLYLNFSGSIDLVTAVALLLGFELPVNFNAPYLARNLREFWRRWHMSLSFFMRDYVFIPLGGSRKGFFRTQVNVMLTMLVSGLWHGASANFLLWGAIHGAGSVLHNLGERLFGETMKNRWLATLVTFHFVCFAWVFFRYSSVLDALHLFSALKDNLHVPPRFNAVLYLALYGGVLAGYRATSAWPRRFAEHLQQSHWAVRPLLLVPLAWAIIVLSPSGVPEFIYARF